MFSWPSDSDNEVAAVRWMWQYCVLLSWDRPLHAYKVRIIIENQYFWNPILRSQFCNMNPSNPSIHKSNRMALCPRFSRIRCWFNVESWLSDNVCILYECFSDRRLQSFESMTANMHRSCVHSILDLWPSYPPQIECKLAKRRAQYNDEVAETMMLWLRL